MKASGILLILVLAGCSAPAQPPGPTLSAEPSLAASAPAYACPPGGVPAEGGFCLASQDTRSEAPTLVGILVHPDEPATWVVLASTFPAVPDATEPDRQVDRAGVDRIRSFVYVTQDDGQAWTRHFLPVLRVGASATSDVVRESSTLATSMAWDDAGVLHVAGYAESQVEEGLCECPQTTVTSEFRVFHVSSPDLGRTWSEVQDLAEWDETLEPRLGKMPGHLALAFGSSEGSRVLLSRDGAATWTTAEGHPDCDGEEIFAPLTDHRFIQLGDDLAFRCRGQGASFFHRLHLGNDTLTIEEGPAEADPESDVPSDCRTVLLRAWRGRPLLVGTDCPDTRLWRQEANGTWAPFLLLDGAPSPGYQTRGTLLRGADVEGDVLHLLLDELDSGPEVDDGDRRLAHVTFSLDGVPLSRAELDVPTITEPEVALRLADSFALDPFAFAGGRGILLLPRGGFSYTFIVP